MSKKKITIIVSSILLLIAAILVYSNYNKGGTSATTKKSEIKLVDVDKVVENPEKFVGLINVEGTVTEVLNDKKFFTLGCEDECIILPVSYKGELPKMESNI